VQLDTAFHDEEAEASARHFADICTAMKRGEQTRRLRFRNADAAIAHGKDGVIVGTLHRKIHEAAFGRILYGIREQVGKNVAEQCFIALRVTVEARAFNGDRTPMMRGGAVPE